MDDKVWELTEEVTLPITVTVPYVFTESFGVPEVETPDLGHQPDW